MARIKRQSTQTCRVQFGGFALIELLCGIVIATLIGVAALSSIHTTQHSLRLRRANYESLELLEQNIQLLASAVKRAQYYDSLSAVIALEDHSQLQPSNILRPALAGSGLLAFLEVTPDIILRRPISALSSNIFCIINLRSISDAAASSQQSVSVGPYVALSVDGAGLLEVTSAAKGKSPRCPGRSSYSILRSSSKKSVLPLIQDNAAGSDGPTLEFTSSLIPVADYYLIYLDREGTLRRRSLLTREDQPIDGPFTEFNVRVLPDKHGRKWAHLRLSSKNEFSKIDLQKEISLAIDSTSPSHHLDLALP